MIFFIIFYINNIDKYKIFNNYNIFVINKNKLLLINQIINFQIKFRKLSLAYII